MSGRSKKKGSSGRSSSSRSRKRSSKKKTNDLTEFADREYAAKKLETDGIDITFLILGMVTSLMIGLLAYSQLKASPATARVLAAADAGESTNEIREIEEKEFEEVVQSGTSIQLQSLLNDLNQWTAEGGTPEVVKKNQRRVDLANKMLTMDLDSQQRTLAITSKLSALETIYGLAFVDESAEVPNVIADLTSCANEYKEDSNESVSLKAKLSLLKINSFENAAKENPDFDQLLDEMCSVMKEYPNDDSTLATVDRLLEYYRAKLGRETAQKIKNRMLARKSEFSSAPKVLALFQDFADEAKLAEVKYAELYENRWVNSTRGQQELLKCSLELAQDQRSGKLVIAEVDRVAHWFEQDGLYEGAKAIYTAIINSADTYDSAEIAAEAKRKAMHGLSRISLVGKTLDFTSVRYDGSPLGPERFENRVVVVLFWSAYNKSSANILESLIQQSNKWKDRGTRILAVNVDRKVLENNKRFLGTLKTVDFVFGDPKKNFFNNILEQSPSSEVPRIMLIKKDGTVFDANVPFSELSTEVSFLSTN